MEQEESKKFAWLRVQNWLGKLFLFLVAGIWMAASLYPHIMAGFFLTERDVPEWGTGSDIGQLVAQSSMILGGVYLNTLLEKIGISKTR